jgi:hypothetical protein
MPCRRFLPLLGLVFGGLALLAPGRAQACGGAFYEGSDVISQGTAHRVAIAMTGGKTVHWDSISHVGAPKDFAWVVPVPATPSDVQLAGVDFFDWLDAESAPTVYPAPRYVDDSGSGFGCGSDTESRTNLAGGIQVRPQGVTVRGQGSVGHYDYAILKAGTGSALFDWLIMNGYTMQATATPLLQWYIDAGWAFVALRVNAFVGAHSLQPVRITYPGEIAALPIHLLRMGPETPVPYVLWVLADKYYEAKTYKNALIDPKRLRWITTTETSNYEDIFAKTLAEQGGDVFVTEYAGPILYPWSVGVAELKAAGFEVAAGADGVRLTRLRTRVLPSLLETDLVLQPTASQKEVSREFHLSGDQFSTGTLQGATLGLLLLTGALVALRRRRGG